MTTQNTPTPLKYERELITKVGGGEVARLAHRYPDGTYIPFPDADFWGPYIVNACNAHEALVEALKAVMRNDPKQDDIAEAALALAEGK